MNPEQIQKAIETLAAKLGIVTEHLYGVLVFQSFVNAIESVLILLILIGINIAFIKLVKHANKTKSEGWYFITSIIGFALFIGDVAFLCNGFNIILTGFMNPEFRAITGILSLVK